MPSQPHQAHRHPSATQRRPCQRPWPALPALTQQRLAQEVARLLQRILDAEVGHVDCRE
jgi:hypothetical protein